MVGGLVETIQVKELSLQIDLPTGLFIDNEFIPSIKGERFDSINPATNEKITSFYVGDSEDVDVAVKSSRRAYETVWSNTSPRERNTLLMKLAELIVEEKETIAALDCIDAGKPYYSNSLHDIDQVLELTQYFGGSAEKFTMGDTIQISNEKLCYTLKDPFGVVALIVPWNYPFAMACWKMQGALAAGNTIIIKPSEITSLSLLFAAKLFKKAGFPPGVVNILPGTGESVGSAMAKHPDIDKISFTGSTLVGGKILAYSSQSNLKDVTLECGGKSAAVVFGDSNLQNAVESISAGIFYNSGQNCTANSRVYVQECIYEKFMALLKDYTKQNWKFGSTYNLFDKECTMGPVVSRKQYDTILEFINSIKTGEGYYEYLQNDPSNVTNGFFIPPTIITDVDQDSDVVQKEIFGPVMCISKFKDYEEAIALANDSDYGLAAMVFTEDINTANKYVRDIKAGTVWVNSSNEEEMSVPFGGYKKSGIGRELGRSGVETFLQTKAVHMPIR